MIGSRLERHVALMLPAVLAAAPAPLATAQCDVDVTRLLASDGSAGDHFGAEVAVDGDTLLVGAPTDDGGSGTVYVFGRGEAGWVEETKLRAPERRVDDRFGFSIALDGDVAIVGSFGDDNELGVDAGSAHVYRNVGAFWLREARLLAPGGDAGDLFGRSVGLSGDVVAVGSRYDASACDPTKIGIVHVYRHDGSAWRHEAVLEAPDGFPGNSFGTSVAVSGDVIVAGAPRDAELYESHGSAYVFRHDGAGWACEAKLTARDVTDHHWWEGHNFGWAAACDGDRIVVGALSDGDQGRNSGSAWTFRHDGAAWRPEAELHPADGAADMSFGQDVAVHGDQVIAGAHFHDESVGAAYSFRWDGSKWFQERKLPAGEGGHFGIGVAVDGETIVAGAPKVDDRRGSAYVLPARDCNGNDVDDLCDVENGMSADCNGNLIPDECEVDCNDNGVPDTCDIADGTSLDCNGDGIPDECDADCNGNGISDACDIADGTSLDCNGNLVPDECDADCDCSGSADGCDLADGSAEDVDGDWIPDACNARGDATGDGFVESVDLLVLLENWGVCRDSCDGGPCIASGDTDFDGDVDVVDLLRLLANWGPLCEERALGRNPGR